jgi:hypothetical protein
LPSDPLKTISNEEQHTLFKDTWKFQWKWFKTVTFLDDKGWLGESIEKTQSIEKDSETTDFYSSNLRNDDRRMFYQTVIFLSHNEHQHHRRYIKLQDVLAISASFMKGIASVCWLFVLWKGQQQLDAKLVDEIFKVAEKQVHADVEEIKTNSMVSTVAIAKKKEVSKVGLLRRVFCWCRSSTTTELSREALSNAISYIHRRIEVTSIVRLFAEFEKVKEVLLSDEQMKEIEAPRNIK